MGNKPGQLREDLFVIVSPDSFNSILQGNHEKLDSLKTHHIRKVLRVSGKVPVHISSGDGRILKAFFNAENDLENSGEPPVTINHRPEILLINPGIKRKNLEFLIKKTTELGVSQIIFLHSSFENFTAEKPERYEKIIINSAEQSKNPLLPLVSQLKESILTYSYSDNVLYFWGDPSGETSLIDLNIKEFSGYSSVCFINGPEGGWSDEEEKFLKNRFRSVRLSQNVLRSETAAITAVFGLKQLFTGRK